MATQPHHRGDEDFFLPDFCGLRMVFAVVVLSQLFAFILTLAPGKDRPDPWTDLALISLFMQWAGLSGAAALCMARRLLHRLGNVRAAVAAYLVLLAIVLAVSEAAFRLILLTPAEHADFLLRNLAIGTIVSALALRYFYVRHQWERRVQAEGEARIQALQARIRPHFLFNSMNTIASLIHSQPQLAENAVEDLSDLFRASLSEARRLIALGEELELVRRYLEIEGLRLGERLRVEWALDGIPDDALLPPLTLQPLLENALYHGIEPLPEGGTVRVAGECGDGILTLSISNPLPPSGAAAHQAGNRMAQDNIRQRLAAHFGDRASLEAVDAGDGYRVTVTLPYRREEP